MCIGETRLATFYNPFVATDRADDYATDVKFTREKTWSAGTALVNTPS